MSFGFGLHLGSGSKHTFRLTLHFLTPNSNLLSMSIYFGSLLTSTFKGLISDIKAMCRSDLAPNLELGGKSTQNFAMNTDNKIMIECFLGVCYITHVNYCSDFKLGWGPI